MSVTNMITILLAFFACSWLPLALCECPAIDEVPVLNPDNPRIFNCGVMYQGPGDYNEIQACNVCPSDGFHSWNLADGEHVRNKLNPKMVCKKKHFSDTIKCFRMKVPLCQLKVIPLVL